MTDISLLAQTAYDTGIDPITYAAEHVIRAQLDRYLPRCETTAALSRRILGDLLDAGWTPPEVSR